MKYIYLILISGLFIGCTPTVPTVTEYRIKTDTTNINYKADGCKNSSIKVSNANAPKSLLTQKMSYGVGEHKQFVYSQSQWSESPAKIVSSEMVKYLRASKLFKSVQNSKSRSIDNYFLEITVEDFMQYFSEDKLNSYVNVSLSLNLIDLRTRKTLATQTFNTKVRLDKLNAEGGVSGLKSALETTLAKSLTFFNEMCNDKRD
jgi:cholesterol transport system auxiliary component